jgi:hypothetical protein
VSCSRSRLLAPLVYLNPCEGGDGQDIHVRVLDLLFIWLQVLPSEQIDLEARGIGRRRYHSTGVDPNGWRISLGLLVIPYGVCNVVHVESRQVVRKGVGGATAQSDEDTSLAPAGHKDQDAIRSFGKARIRGL